MSLKYKHLHQQNGMILPNSLPEFVASVGLVDNNMYLE